MQWIRGEGPVRPLTEREIGEGDDGGLSCWNFVLAEPFILCGKKGRASVSEKVVDNLIGSSPNEK
jgi:hypothetical protein